MLKLASPLARIDNSPPLEPQAQEWESNLEPGSPRAAGPMDCWTACLHFSGIKPLQADAKDDGPCSEADQAKEIIAPSGMPITAPNRGTKATTISFMSLKSTPATNQEPTQERGTGPQPSPMTMTLEQDNQFKISQPSCPTARSFCPPGAPFRPVHFTDYPLKPKYKDYTPEKILELDLLAHIQSAIRYNHQVPWIFLTPKLFRGKSNYLPAYNIYMELPIKPKLMPASSPNLPTNHTNKLFGIVYITLMGVVDTIILAAGPWTWVGKSASYLLKLAPL
ncbi:hypothetical protein DSO57_1013083 [Entomophthora muscae]|uniref:Uncharacterized protein n=1 Tax=Entomophthora muscae TaxID=34485 RepID=A0ACC2SIV1_9FUNG|nr:hypothetical protein DSO57_1013083 [Entomophthora muscae]